MKTIGVVTVGRSDFGILRPLLNEIEQHGGLNLVLYVTGAHLSPEFGNTQDEITEAGFEVAEKVEVTLSSDSAAGISKSMGLGVLGFSEVFSRQAPDILVIMGDRFEMMAAALAAVPFNIQIAHIHGG
ncbi:MAG: UDP-N-acetylglucosamine 2-epimerase, partial [Verrucomicrobiota bacterium]